METDNTKDGIFKKVLHIPTRPDFDCWEGTFAYDREGISYIIHFPMTTTLTLDKIYQKIEQVKDSKGDPEIAFSDEYQLLKDFVVNIACGQYDIDEVKEAAKELYLLNRIDFPRYTS